MVGLIKSWCPVEVLVLGKLLSVQIRSSKMALSVGSGNSSFWFSNQSNLGTLTSLVPFVHVSNLDLKVCDVWSNDHQALRRLSTGLPPDLASHLNSMCIWVHPLANDRIVQGGDISSKYSMSLGYHQIKSRHGNNLVVNDFLQIWKLQTFEKYKHLIWLAFHGAIPTNDLRFRRSMCNSPICTCCNKQEESIVHCLRDCEKAKKMQDLLREGLHESFQGMDARQWLRGLANRDDNILCYTTIWWIWRSRNAEVMNSQIIFEGMLLHKIFSKVVALRGADWIDHHPPKESHIVKWIQLVQGYVKINVDGSSRGNPS